MKALVRKTANGNEYWDTEAKKVLFVAKGEQPDFDVTDNPVPIVNGVYQEAEKDLKALQAKAQEMGKVTKLPFTEPDGIHIDDMNTEQLLAFAKQVDINVPGNMKKEETIRNFINDVMTDDE